MPRFLVPKRSGVHRLACLSLYHSLLKQCSRLQRVNITGSNVRQLVEVRFRKYRDLNSPSQIVNSLKAGYEALDLLSSCSQGNLESFRRFESLIGKTAAAAEVVHQRREIQASKYLPEFRENNPKLRKALRKREARARRSPAALRPHPDTKPILSIRPRPYVSGIRRVPVFVNARGVPFLRIKKPQPPSLSRALRSKLDHRWKKIERHYRLTEELSLAKLEDRWDKIIGEDEEETYTNTIASALDQNACAISYIDQKNAELAKSMWEVVLKERELAKKEKEERRANWLAANKTAETNFSEKPREGSSASSDEVTQPLPRNKTPQS